MKVFLTVFSAMMLLTAAGFAQITIHNTDFSPIGYSYSWGTSSDQETFSVGGSGANQTWTFGAFPWVSAERRTYVAPSSAPHGSIFPTATRAEHIEPNFGGEEAESWEFEQINPATYVRLGTEVQDSVTVYDPPMVNASLPMTYGMQWQAILNYDFTMIDTILLAFHDSLRYTSDGWGTITTPYGSWPALRMAVHHWITISLNGSPIQAFELLSYTWVNQQGNSVVVLTSEINETNPNFTTGTIAMMGVPLAAEPVRGPVAQGFTVGQNYPNPFNPNTAIPVTLEKSSRVTLDVFDELGQIVSHAEQMLPAGSHLMTVDGSRWAAGMYFARLSAGSEQKVLKMNLLK